MYLIVFIILFCVLYLLFHLDSFSGKREIGFGKESDILSFWNKGIEITGMNVRLSLSAIFRHILVVGQSGSGKSQSVFLPILLRAKGKFSYVVHDPSGEIRKKTINYLRKIGYKIKVLNLANPDLSNFYNPLKRIGNNLASAKKLAHSIVSASLGESNGDAKFWNNKAEHLLSVLILLTKQLDPKYHHMGTVLYLLNTFSAKPSSLDVFASEHLKKPKDFLEYASIIATDPKLLSNVVSTVKASLSLYESEDIMRICSKDDISFSQMREKPTAIFLEGDIMSLKFNAPLFSLAISDLMKTLLARLPEKGNLAVVLLLDEFGVLTLPNFSDFLSNSRKYLVSCVLGIQSTGQIIAKYGKEEGGNILANTFIQMYFGNQPVDTSLLLEKMCGYEEIQTKDGRKERHQILPANRIRLLPKDRAIIMVGGFKPILARLRPAYKNYILKRRMNLPPEETVTQNTEQEIPLPFIPKPIRVK